MRTSLINFVSTNQGVLKYACGSRLRLVCYLVCTSFLLGMCSGKSQGAQLMRQPSLMYCLEHGEMLPWMDLWVYGDSRVFYFQRLGVQQVQEKVLQIAWLLEPGDY